MSNKKLSPDAFQAELDRLRDASRTRARRLQSAASVILTVCLALFLTLSVFAATKLWDQLRAPVLVAVVIGALAISLQQVLGLAIHDGRLRRGRHQLLWWAAVLISGAAYILLAG